MRAFCLTLLAAGAAFAAEPFVLVKGGLLRPGIRVDDFEMLDHPLTNAEYKLFVDATKHPAPLHWEKGAIAAGMENHPVIFVNRYDVAAYLAWRSKKEDRIYRLPTGTEFEWAARGGDPNARYPWGNEAPEGRANFDASGDRSFSQWRKFLKPVKSYKPNPYGLYDMAGNVWQMVDSYHDPAVTRYKYRIASEVDLENGLAGGSWARTESYIRCAARGGASPGIRHPDVGFRPVREPAGASHFHRQPRRVIAANAGSNAVFIGWQLLPHDAPGTGFHIYRSTRRDAAGERITAEPLRQGTNYLDRSPGRGRVYYRVRPVAEDGKEGAPSEWAAVEPAAERDNVIAVFEPTAKLGGFVPVFGDLNGDGVLDVVARLDNGIREMSRDPGVPIELEALTTDGRALWRRPLVYHDHCFGNANNVPVVVYDLDGDGKAEVITRIQEGDGLFLAVLDGMTGRVRRKAPWTKMATDFAKTSTRVHMSVAYLNGKTPAIVTQTGLYENEIYDAYDANLNRLWQHRSFGETSGSGSHHCDIADVDGDGRDEVFNGTTLLNPNGTIRWSIYRQHPDIVAVKRILPDAKDRQVYYAVESGTHAGAYLVDAKTGRILWKVNREDDPRWVHAHTGWASDIFASSPGLEMLANRDGHTNQDPVLFSAEGKILMNPFPSGLRPINWTGGQTRELMNGAGTKLVRFTGNGVEPVSGAAPNERGSGSCSMVADLAGDFRDEAVCVADGKIMVRTNLDPLDRREITRTASREYRLWMARNMGGGYASYFEWQE
ncbi:MAG: SUMF1/EgtB/PvdO family nonheme iron enzyme [Bryobacteraceae bacterium]